MRSFTVLAMIGLSTLNTPAIAEDQDLDGLRSAFSGQWFTFEPSNGLDGICSLTFTLDANGTGNRAVPGSCSATLGATTAWRILDGRIMLEDESGEPLAVLGGNQFRISGDFTGRGSVILERSAGDERSVSLVAAITRYRCYYMGFTDNCASEIDLLQPSFEDEQPPAIRTLVNLNVRSQPRYDTEVIGTLKTGTRVVLDECLVASDGLWCAASFSDRKGWMARSALRQDEWPVLTFVLDKAD